MALVKWESCSSRNYTGKSELSGWVFEVRRCNPDSAEWTAIVREDGKPVVIGRAATLREAQLLAEKYHGNFAW